MNYKLIFSIARSLLMARWKQTLIAAIGVTFSITMFIALLGFMTGLNGLLDGLVLNRTPHIRLFNEIRPSSMQPVIIILYILLNQLPADRIFIIVVRYWTQ